MVYSDAITMDVWEIGRNTAKVALSTLFTRIEQSWRLCSSVKFVGLCIARSSSVPEKCNHSQSVFSAIAYLLPLSPGEDFTEGYWSDLACLAPVQCTVT